MKGFSQRHTAWLTAVAFVLGTIAIPALHLAFHALPHDHVAAATHYHAAPAGDHHHDTDLVHRAEVADHHHEDDGRSEADDEQPFDPQHGAGSAAHFALAISDAAAAPFILPLHALTPAHAVAATTSVLVAAAHVSVRRFRGPPCG